MATIMMRKKDGKITGRCDARCYNAKSKFNKCKCICGGINHGKGINAAITFVADHGKIFKDLYKSDEIQIKQGQFQIV